MPLQAGKSGAHISPHQIERQLRPYDPRAQAHHVAIVIFNSLVRREDIVAGRRPDSPKLIRCHARAGAAAAEQYRALGAALENRLCNSSGVVGIVHRIRRVRPTESAV